MTKAEIEQALQVLADRFGLAMRSPILRSPAELGLDCENITFPSQDGVPLEGWFIPAPGSDKIIIANHPGAFEGVRCVVGPQPISLRVTLERSLALSSIPADRVDDLAQRIRLHTSFTVDDMFPVHAAESVMIPTFLYQVRGDLLTRPSDVQSMYDNIPVKEKKLFWIEGSSRRWDGYAYFAKDPSQMLEWFDTYMK
jgi:hypothetical protein